MTAPPLLDTAEECARWLRADYPDISVQQIRDWARRGHITRHEGCRYVAREIADYLDHRPDADKRRARRTCKQSVLSAIMSARDASPETG
jgi:hypothetical protein